VLEKFVIIAKQGKQKVLGKSASKTYINHGKNPFSLKKEHHGEYYLPLHNWFYLPHIF